MGRLSVRQVVWPHPDTERTEPVPRADTENGGDVLPRPRP